MLKVDSICCIRQDRCLFEDLSFELHQGQIVQLEGQNGAGKTSLLRILAGFVRAESGKVLWQGQDIAKDNLQFASDTLYIGHKTGVNGQLTAVENLAFWLETHGLETQQDLHDVLAQLGLVGLEDVPVRLLSAGQQRRVALARLWLNKATLWMLDEPFTAVDKKGVVLLQQQFKKHLAQGGAIILTSHQDLTEHFPELSRLVLEYRF
ncbi:MAG: cytochrome c biogenesis heme-transporting ATPase CcmA [Pseudoalteromonas spongiae]|uniref:Cytochrome c biogenesis heme-transporting ATPase CcmA n=1 Tax=Pseudoalteromonas spongiae TaxID=298657 RepID=A0ABU8ESH4_9GAMM|nr:MULTISPECIES: cytochrome c biogenesis heme-transporting ATPase CcmA [Pseudoalteromonas]ATC98221.1 heme exporter protein A [Pseudoalteromonas spongiae UST010723-006]KPV97602.1 Cytochrome c biogenesis ATP-binding export protein CcmA [Pseudoalteromonas sp. P1-9]MCF6457912.1 cytochrome c biogenesis heme-transporting ATPase CcmA [Pseudoalteromonas sp. MMG024]MEC8328767.1 cytochrome c biogenesis heme-transporting ATPase CcmA [Pseudomonadota bacterium]